MFIKLTHSRSGEVVFVRADTIKTIRVKEGKTLLIGDRELGFYVDEDPIHVKKMVEAVMLSNEFPLKEMQNV